MTAYADKEMTIEVEAQSGTIRLAWRGRSNARDPGASLHPFFEAVADEAARTGAQIEMRLHDLEYFNSSTLAAIVRALRRFREQNTRVLVSDRESGWRRRSINVLRVLERDGVLEVQN